MTIHLNPFNEKYKEHIKSMTPRQWIITQVVSILLAVGVIAGLSLLI